MSLHVWVLLIVVVVSMEAEGTVCYRPVRKICTRDNGDSAVGLFWFKVNGTQTDIGFLSEVIPLSGMLLRYTTSAYDSPCHVAPRKQFIINMDAGHEVVTSEGQEVVFERGELFYVEDTWGKGHISRAHDGASRHSMFLEVEQSFDAGPCSNATKPPGYPQCQ
eukprot:Sspe_Gene.119054::Locus_113965_Transcript_1_2_Confidence_0.667_Length_609::g.119054::m.119054